MDTGEKELEYALPWDTIQPALYSSMDDYDELVKVLLWPAKEPDNENQSANIRAIKFNVFENNKIENFRNELNQLDEHLNNSNREKTFYESSLKEKVDILNNLQKSNKKPLRGIYLIIKSSVATSYFRSEVGAKQVLKYNGPSIVLGDYKGCIPFEEVGKTWAI